MKNVSEVISESLRGSLSSEATDVRTEKCELETGDLLKAMVDAIYDAMDQVTVKALPFSKDELTEAIEALFKARIAYVSGGKIVCDGKPFHPKDILYPTVFGPVLEMIAKYEDPGRGLFLIPTLKGYDERKGVQLPSRYMYIMQLLEIKGMYMSRGLPMAKVTKDPGIYKLSIVAGSLYGSDPVIPDPSVVMTRILLNMNYLAEIFGLASVRYGALGVLQSGLNQIVWRMINTPKVSATTVAA